jgi:TRAP transporter TAXI family solute receptor
MASNAPAAAGERGSRRRALVVLTVLLSLVVAALIVSLFWQPAPPKRVVMSTGAPGGGYQLFAERYRALLAEQGIELELRPSSGAVENLRRLHAPRGAPDAVDVAIVQGGLEPQPGDDDLVSLGNLFLEPLWLFAPKAKNVADLRDLGGLRVAIGAPGSGTLTVARRAMQLYRLDTAPTVLLEIGGEEAERALLEGRADAAFYVAAPDSPLIQRLVADPGLALIGVPRADAFARREPTLSKVVLPAGVLDLPADLPPADLTMVSTTAMLLAREDIHPVIVDLLIEASRRIHRGASVLNPPGMFPNAAEGPFRLSPEAVRYHREGPGMLRRVLPLWTAVWVQRLLLVGIPLAAVFAPLLHFAPIVWRWIMRRRIYRWYGELKRIEHAVRAGRGDPGAQLRRIDAIDEHLQRLRVPNSFGSDLYAMRSHLLLVRGMLVAPHASGGAPIAEPVKVASAG